MVRPSQNIDKKLIELGKKQIIEKGIAGLSIRSICVDSGINLGMFYYYFKTKENFVKVLLTGLHQDIQSHWIKESESISDPLEKLKAVLNINVRMFKERKGVIETIMKGIDLSDKFYIQILKELHERWLKFYSDLIEDCKESGYFDKNVDTHNYVAIFAGSVPSYLKIHHASDLDTYYKEAGKFIDFLIEKLKNK